MIVQAHVLRFVERRLHRVVACRLVGWVPVRDGGTGRDVQAVAFLGDLRVLELATAAGLRGVDLPPQPGTEIPPPTTALAVSWATAVVAARNDHDGAGCNGRDDVRRMVVSLCWRVKVTDDYSARYAVRATVNVRSW